MARNSVIVLPTSASELNRIMAATEVARSDGIEEIVSVLWDPWKCPTEFLPYLAWALSVDVFEDHWSEARKRSVIAASPMVHRRKGTVGAVRASLQALGVDTEVVEWHLTQPVSRRGTFVVRAFFWSVEDFMELRSQVERAVKRSKPKSRTVDFKHFFRQSGHIHSAGFMRLGGIIRHANERITDQNLPTSIKTATIFRVVGFIKHEDQKT